MTSLSALETLLSLAVQVTLLIVVAAVVVRRHKAGRNADYCWAALHICILLATAAAFFLLGDHLKDAVNVCLKHLSVLIYSFLLLSLLTAL